MEISEKNIIVIGDKKYHGILKISLNTEYNFIIKPYTVNINRMARLNKYEVIVYLIEELTENIIAFIKKVNILFTTIPTIGVIRNLNAVEQARYCGMLGINSVLTFSEIQNICNEIQNLQCSNPTMIKLSNLGIKKVDFPLKIKRALEIIEADYLHITTIEEITSIMDVNEKYLYTEFQKNKLIPPKKILMYFKVFHSLIIMQNPGYNLQDIASLSGFTNQKRYCECFNRIFADSPRVVRKKIRQLDSLKLEIMFQNIIKRLEK